MQGDRRQHTGFSIIELIVVIGVVMVLIGILLPVLGGARASALELKQGANIRQVGTIIDLYANDWDDTFPIADLKPRWSPLDVPRADVDARGLGRNWEEALFDANVVDRKTFDEIFYQSYAYDSITMTVDPKIITPTTLPVWEEFFYSAVKRHWTTYPALKGLVGVSFVPRGNHPGDRIAPSGYRLWFSGDESNDPKAPLLLADGSVQRLKHGELLKPVPPPGSDGWGIPIITTWQGVRGRDR